MAWWMPPDVGKALGDWLKFGLLVSAAVGVAAGFFVTPQDGAILGGITAVLTIGGCLLYRLVPNTKATLAVAEPILKSSDYVAVDERTKLITLLKSDFAKFQWVFIGVLVVAIASLSFLLVPYISRMIRMSRLERLDVEYLRYHNPSKDKPLIDKAPFLQSVIAALTREGINEKKDFRLVIGQTNPMTVPTRAAKGSIRLGNGKFAFAGYVFRVSPSLSFEPLKGNYVNEAAVKLTIPPLEQGDSLLLIGRITPIGDEAFPDNLQETSTLTIEGQ